MKLYVFLNSDGDILEETIAENHDAALARCQNAEIGFMTDFYGEEIAGDLDEKSGLIVLKKKKGCANWEAIPDYRKDYREECKNEGYSRSAYNEDHLATKLEEEGSLKLMWADYKIL